ncbi:MAG: histidine kinase [Actinomycetota bacterium]
MNAGRELPTATDAEIEAIQEEALDYLVDNLKTDQFWTVVASLFFYIAPLTFGLDPWSYVMATGGLGVVAFRMLAFRFYARRDVTNGLLVVTAGTWVSTIYIVWILPEALPITMVSVIGPLMLTTLYFPARLVRRLIVVGTALSLLLGTIAFTQDGAEWRDETREWMFIVTILIYLAAHVLLWTIDVRESNRIRLAAIAKLTDANTGLRAADAALRESRRRLVAAGDAERVRIERNIHDGAQQRLVALAMQLNLARQLAERGQDTTADALGEFHAATLEAVDELRELAQGVYPAVLAERGLTDALRAVSRRSAQSVRVDGPDELRLSKEDEAAVYFVCVEAIQNAAKHAPAETVVSVGIVAVGGDIVIEIADDGPGFDAAAVATSRGMANMADRMAALGASIEVMSTPGDGSTVRLVVPTGNPADPGGD